jgi:hypothetical protein
MFFRKKAFKVSGTDLYKAVIKTFDTQEWRYNNHPDDNMITTTFGTEEMPIGLFIKADDNFINFRGILAFQADCNNQYAIIEELNAINDNLVFGSFRLNTESGYLTFNYSLLCPDAVPSITSIATVVAMVIETVDEYDDKLQAIAPNTGSIPDNMYG